MALQYRTLSGNDTNHQYYYGVRQLHPTQVALDANRIRAGDLCTYAGGGIAVLVKALHSNGGDRVDPRVRVVNLTNNATINVKSSELIKAAGFDVEAQTVIDQLSALVNALQVLSLDEAVTFFNA